MRLRFGRYAGMTTEVLLLRAPDYVAWTLARRPRSALARTFAALADAFDARSIQASCSCGRAARHARAYRASSELILLCEACAGRAPPGGGLDEVTGYRAALEHVRETCVRGHRREQQRLIRGLGRAKGMPKRITEAAAARFLAGAGPEAGPAPAAAPAWAGAAPGHEDRSAPGLGGSGPGSTGEA